MHSKKLSKVDSIVLSRFICAKIGSLSHLKLQKLLFYTQAFHLAYFEEPIIEDEFEAWLHGPVSKKVFIHFRHEKDFMLFDEFFVLDEFKEKAIRSIEEAITEDQLDLISEVLEVYGVKTGIDLENLTHSEGPWINARKGVPIGAPCSNIIPKEEIREYYKLLLYGQKQEN